MNFYFGIMSVVFAIFWIYSCIEQGSSDLDLIILSACCLILSKQK